MKALVLGDVTRGAADQAAPRDFIEMKVVRGTKNNGGKGGKGKRTSNIGYFSLYPSSCNYFKQSDSTIISIIYNLLTST
jgi:hypothetical protein